MPSLIKTCSMTEFRRGLSTHIARVIESGEPLLITRRGKGVAVLLSFKQYEHMQRERDRLVDHARAEGVGSRAAALRCVLKGSGLDEVDYRRYLEEKHR